MGLFSTKTKTKSEATTMPIAPEWAEGPIADVYGRTQEIGRADPNQFVSGVNPLQAQAGQMAGGLGSSGLFGEAADMTRGALAGGPSAAGAGRIGATDQYMNPYLENVLGSTVGQFDKFADRTMEGLALRSAGGNTGSNAAVGQALAAGELGDSLNSTISNILFGSQDRAFGLAENQANRDQQINMLNAQLGAQYDRDKLAAGGQLGQLASLFGGDQRANVGTMADLGTLLRGVDTEQRQAPLDLLDFQTSQYAKTAPSGSLFFGQNQTGTSTSKSSGGLGNQLLQVGGALGAAYLGR